MAEDSSVNDYRKHLWDALRAGQEQYDKYLLTLSSGGLAISLTLLKDVFGNGKITSQSILVSSWVLFCCCIITTIISFLTSQQCIKNQLVKYEGFIATRDDTKLNEADALEKMTARLNYASGIFLVLAITATITFASINILRGASMTSRLTIDGNRGYTPPPAPAKPDAGYTPPPPPTQHTPTTAPVPPPQNK